MAEKNDFRKDYRNGTRVEKNVSQILNKHFESKLGEENFFVEITDRDEQHLGDFKTVNDFYVEIKADFYAETTGNICVELAEIYGENRKNKSRQVELVGIIKHSHYGEDTVIIHQFGKSGENFLVYNPDELIKYLLIVERKNRMESNFAWSSDGDHDRYLLNLIFFDIKNNWRNKWKKNRLPIYCANKNSLGKIVEKFYDKALTRREDNSEDLSQVFREEKVLIETFKEILLSYRTERWTKNQVVPFMSYKWSIR